MTWLTSWMPCWNEITTPTFPHPPAPAMACSALGPERCPRISAAAPQHFLPCQGTCPASPCPPAVSQPCADQMQPTTKGAGVLAAMLPSSFWQHRFHHSVPALWAVMCALGISSVHSCHPRLVLGWPRAALAPTPLPKTRELLRGPLPFTPHKTQACLLLFTPCQQCVRGEELPEQPPSLAGPSSS